tara:strand:- start:309 stop:773 length:465 start_codon:yes stop_codon:yes gene_type:complete
MNKINPSQFKKVMGSFASGITVISINDKDIFYGKTVSSFASLSLKPPLVSFALDKRASSLKKYLNTNYLGINILSKNQKNLSLHFSYKKIKWGNIEYFLSDNNVPMISNSLANIECKKINTYKAGDHIIFICKVISSKVLKRKKPLIYFQNKYI